MKLQTNLKPYSLGILLLFLMVLGFANVAWAKKGKRKIGTFGLGVAADLSATSDEGAPPDVWMLIPVQLGNFFRIEPEFGMRSLASEQGKDGNIKRSTLNLRGGLGLLFTYPVTTKGLVTAGVRAGAIVSTGSQERDGDDGTITTESSQFGFYAGAASGGEFFLSSSVSIGGEIWFGAVRLGDIETTGEEADNSQEDFFLLGTSGTVALRWYFL